MDYALIGNEWTAVGYGSLDFIDLLGGTEANSRGAPAATAPDRVPLAAVMPTSTGEVLVWTGELGLDGVVTSTSGDVPVQRGHGNAVSLSSLLTERPPSILFIDGHRVHGREIVLPTSFSNTVPEDLVLAEDWTGVDIAAESKPTAARRAVGISIHEWLETWLANRPRRGRHRWIVSNDGPGEIADYIVIETLPTGQIAVDLWHAKFAGGGAPSVRVGDFEVVSAQAIKSRRWPTERSLWSHLAARLRGTEHPQLLLVEGRQRQLEVLLGLHTRWEAMSLNARRPSVVSRIGIVQPGLSRQLLTTDLSNGITSAVQIAQLLTVFSDAVSAVAQPVVVAAA